MIISGRILICDLLRFVLCPSCVPLPPVQPSPHFAVVVMCMHSVLIGGAAQHKLLTTALDMRMIARGYVFIPYDTLLYSLPYQDTPHYILGNHTKLGKAYDGVLTITMDSGRHSFYEAFREAQNSFEIRSSIPPEQVQKRAKLYKKTI